MNDSKNKPSRKAGPKQGRAPQSSERKLKEKKQEAAALKKRVRYQNKEYTLVSGFFVLIFLSLIVYVIYFNVEKSQEFINSPYNTRQNTFADRVIRGNIESSDGQILAYTEVQADGSEERIYPYGRIFSHAVGFDSNGKSGLESEGNFQLLSSHSFLLNQIKNQLSGRKNKGDTVISTLDYTIQNTAYQALGDRRGAVIAIEPSTGKILAMVSKPDFDPNTLASDWEYYINDSESGNLLNRATNGQYPPGSVFKIVTALDYLREKGDLNSFQFNCEGTVTKSEHTIRCYNGHVHGQEDMRAAFANSCNTAFASIGTELGGASLRKVSEALLFNQNLPYSGSKKSVFSLNQNSGTPLIMQTAIGQGDTLVSPLHMALLTSCIANHGVLMEPYLIDSVKNEEGITISKNKPQAYKRLMTKEEAALLENLMKGVVSGGTATALSGRSYTVAGKTGSAEFNSSGSSHSWFVGYCSTDKTDMAVAVIVENGGTGSEAAVPIAGQLFDAYYTSQAAQETKDNTLDYSDYEEDFSGNSDNNGWFDILEEDYQEYNPEDFNNWDNNYENGNGTGDNYETMIPEPDTNIPGLETPDIGDWGEQPEPDIGIEEVIPEDGTGPDVEWFPEDESEEQTWEIDPSQGDESFDVSTWEEGEFQ